MVVVGRLDRRHERELLEVHGVVAERVDLGDRLGERHRRSEEAGGSRRRRGGRTSRRRASPPAPPCARAAGARHRRRCLGAVSKPASSKPPAISTVRVGRLVVDQVGLDSLALEVLDATSDEALLVVGGEEGDDAHGSGRALDSREGESRGAHAVSGRVARLRSAVRSPRRGSRAGRASRSRSEWSAFSSTVRSGADPCGRKRRTATWFELTAEPLAELGGVRPARDDAACLRARAGNARSSDEIEIHVDYEVHALRDFARAHGLDFQALAYGRESFDQFHGYRILGARPGEAATDRGGRDLPARRALRQPPDAARSCHSCRPRARCRRRSTCRRCRGSSRARTARSRAGLTYVGYSDLDDIDAPSLFGTFLFEDLEPAVTTLDGELRQRLVDRHVSSLFRPPPLGEPRPANHVAVHIRSGRSLRPPRSPSELRQPPLAFYTLALSHFASAHGGRPRHARLRGRGESGDRGAAGVSRAAAVSPYTVSSASLSDDLAELLEHRALVLGRGSFGVAVAALSSNLETLYFPWSEPRFPGLVRERGLEGYLIEEIVASLHRCGEWTNSAEQRRLDDRVPGRQPQDPRLRSRELATLCSEREAPVGPLSLFDPAEPACYGQKAVPLSKL